MRSTVPERSSGDLSNVPPVLFVELLEQFRVEDTHGLGTVHDLDLGQPRLADASGFGDGLLLVVGHQLFDHAVGDVLLAEAFHGEFDCALGFV
jgi:hypothetical protein